MTAVNELLNLSAQQILITGASGTIGAGIAHRCVEAGARVALHYRSNRAGIDGLLHELGEQAIIISADIADADGVAAMFATLEAENFTPTAIVNNAADQSVAALSELSAADWQRMMATNLDSVFTIGKHAATNLQGCNLVNISSIESLDPAMGHGHYATSKAALNMLTRAQALEFGELNMRVNSISPGLIRREGIEQAWPEGVARWQDRAPLTRLGEAEDVADAALFLISDAARWITGANLVVVGGMTAQSNW
jgi:NAD(P)-dependent dehydrogenase (short-subunit alcohol dehydrogenase family)